MRVFGKIKFKNKIFFKLLSYFGLSLLVFSIVVGIFFYYVFRQNTILLHKKNLEERAIKISETLSDMWFSPRPKEFLKDGGGKMEKEKRKLPKPPDFPNAIGNLNNQNFQNGNSPKVEESPKIGEKKENNKNLHEIDEEQENSFRIFRSMKMIENIAMAEVWILDAKTRNIVQGEKNQSISYFKLPPNAEDTIKKALDGKVTTTENFNDYLSENSITVAVPIKNGTKIEGVVLLHSPIKYLSLSLKSGTYTLVLSIVIALFLASIAAIWLSASFTDPLNKIKNTTLELAKGNYEIKTDVKQSDEIGELAKSIDILALELDKSLKERKRFERMRQDFIANVSHELRTPITVIRGSIEAICDGIITDPAQLYEYNHQILADSIHMQGLINDLIDLTKLQNLDFSIREERISLNDIINDVVRSMKQISAKKNIKINFEMENPKENYLFRGDYQRIRQMIIIVVDNAIKFSKENQKIDILLKTVGNKYELKIVDTGKGINSENIGEIFNRYHKSDCEENKNGMGLGLAIAKEIAQRHNILINVESEPNVKTIFTFFIKKLKI
ncbi:sensor histidine kinase [Leptotrichia sp. oral taxon 847]|uniref:sensor histidine kinase n=1 Tax=Leptotrichia sp. oral taxon 847 TaxID=1785996 RepID=UPI0007684253|nr:histidine kinase [Leptotrichia sp. oral taxon 847]